MAYAQHAMQIHDEHERPKHMQRKAKLHQKKALLESDSIEQTIKYIKGNETSGFLRNSRDSNFRCNDDEEQTNTGYKCSKMDQLSFISNAELGSLGAVGCGFDYINDIWGWESPFTKKKYAIAGMWDGTSFVDITDQKQPKVLGFLDMEGKNEAGDCDSNFWRDVKVLNDVVYIGAEAIGSGLQLFDLKRLDSLPRPTATSEPLTRGQVPRLEADSHIESFGASHNLIEFPDMDKLLVVGYGSIDETTACSVSDGETVAILSGDPLNPTIECLELASVLNPKNKEPYAMMNTYPGYVHDGQCFIYDGPDDKYRGTPLCIFFAETEIGIYDMRNRKMISKFTYNGATYVHQGWVSEDFTTLYANDEADEECRSGQMEHCSDLDDKAALPIIRIFDITSLENVGEAREYINTNQHASVDHNMYVKGDYIYSANYEAGARVYKIQEDKSLKEVAYYDLSNDCEDIINCNDPFGGAWTHFPYSDSTTITSNGFYGLHVFHTRLQESIFS